MPSQYLPVNIKMAPGIKKKIWFHSIFLGKRLDNSFQGHKIVNIVNKSKAKITQDHLLKYQSRRLQDLIREILQCCQERMLFESQKFGLPQAELKCLMLFDVERYLTVKGIAQRMEVRKAESQKSLMDWLENSWFRELRTPTMVG